MSMSSFIARLIRDEDGGPLVEVAIILPILITFLFGGVDFMNALYQWNAAAKAAEIGARIAAVSDPVASGLNSIPANVLSSSVASGSPMPDFTVSCDGGAAACAYLLALFSIPKLHAALGAKYWRALNFVGMNYLAYAFIVDFVKLPLGGSVAHVAEYLPFAFLSLAGPSLRLAAFVKRAGQSRALWSSR